MRREIASVLMFVLVGASGCEGGGMNPPPPPPPPPEGDLQIGGSEASGIGFVELEDMDEVELVAGAQGGYHVWTTFRVRETAGPLYLRREARLVEDGTLVLKALPTRVDVPEEAMSGWWVKEEALPSFMCPPPVGLTVYDKEIAFDVRLTDQDGEEIYAEDHLVVKTRCPEGDLETCHRICSDG